MREHHPGRVFSVGFLRPLSGFRSRCRRPCSSLDLMAQFRTAIRNLRSYSTIRSLTGLPLEPILSARRSWTKWSQSQGTGWPGRGSVRRTGGTCAWRPSRDPANVCPWGTSPPRRRCQKRSQRERLRLSEPCGELVRAPIGPSPVAVTQRPGEPSTVLPPLDLVEAGLVLCPRNIL